jgi:nucleotide-binding universal stress UspA family protein
MSDLNRIVVAADGSEQGDEAVRQADAWARAHRGRLVVCHVAPRLLGVNSFFPQLAEKQMLSQTELEQELERALRAHVAGLIDREPSDFETVVESGAPDVELVRAADEQSAWLVVVGSHGHSGLAQIFLGDVAERVVRHAHCPVLVARPHSATHRILVGTDLSSGARLAVVLAAEHARRTGARLTIACSVERQMDLVRGMTSFGASHGFVQSEYEGVCAEARKQLLEQLHSVGGEGDTVVFDGAAAPAIVRAAADLDADLVVIGATGATGFKRAQLGRVAEKIVRAAPCSVLVARANPR